MNPPDTPDPPIISIGNGRGRRGRGRRGRFGRRGKKEDRPARLGGSLANVNEFQLPSGPFVRLALSPSSSLCSASMGLTELEVGGAFGN